jgi:hypothetical protein
VVGQLAAAAKLKVTELKEFGVSRPFEVSTTGLADALSQLQKRCATRGDIPIPAALRQR